MGVQYLYRSVSFSLPYRQTLMLTTYMNSYATLIVFANYLLEAREGGKAAQATFPAWLKEHREITTLLAQRSLE